MSDHGRSGGRPVSPERKDAAEGPDGAERLDAAEKLAAACEQLIGPIDSIAPIDAGTGGAAFELETGGRRLHAKLVSRRSARTLPLAAEFGLLDQLASEGLAPEPVAYDVTAGVLITAFLENHRALGSSELRAPELLARVSALLSRVHTVAADAPDFDPVAIANRYIGAAGPERPGRAAGRQAEELLALAEEWARDTERPRGDEARALCHCDLVAENFMLGPGLVLVDFEYAQLAPPVLDLATLSVMNRFTQADDSRLLAAYFDDRATPFSTGDFAKVRRMVALIAHFWALTQGPERPGIGRYVLD